MYYLLHIIGNLIVWRLNGSVYERTAILKENPHFRLAEKRYSTRLDKGSIVFESESYDEIIQFALLEFGFTAELI
jgi:hypothetical protein